MLYMCQATMCVGHGDKPTPKGVRVL